MIDIEIQISISERSSGWATNYQVAEVTMSQYWWCKASDFFSFHLSQSFSSATIFCSKPSIVRPGGRRRGSSRALAGIPPPQPQPWQKGNSFDQWLKSPYMLNTLICRFRWSTAKVLFVEAGGKGCIWGSGGSTGDYVKQLPRGYLGAGKIHVSLWNPPVKIYVALPYLSNCKRIFLGEALYVMMRHHNNL